MYSNDNRTHVALCNLRNAICVLGCLFEIKINRIAYEPYFEFIEQVARENWKKPVSEGHIKTILELTDCHPYYVNRLCRLVWDHKTAPSIGQIRLIWEEYVERQRTDGMADTIGRLTINQRVVLAALARQPVTEPHGKDFTTQLKVSSSSMQRTIPFLLKSDFIYKNKEGYYCVLNPAIRGLSIINSS